MTFKKPIQRILVAIPFLLAAGLTYAEPNKDTSDASITKQVKEKISEDPALRSGAKIHVNTKNGVVSLSGLVDTRTERSDVVAKVTSVPGVKSVNDGIAINNNPS